MLQLMRLDLFGNGVETMEEEGCCLTEGVLLKIIVMAAVAVV
jgi:hypothetical protein